MTIQILNNNNVLSGKNVLGFTQNKNAAIPKSQQISRQNQFNSTDLKTYSKNARNLGLSLISFQARLPISEAGRVLEKTNLYPGFIKSGKSFFEFVKNIEAKPSQIKEFLYGITSNPEHSRKFIAEVIKDPRQSKNITRILTQKIGGKREFADWYVSNKGYTNAFSDFCSVEFTNAKNADEIVKIIPNPGIWQVKAAGGKMGKIPSDFADETTYNKLIDTMRESKGVKLFKNLDEETKDLNKFLLKYPEALKKYPVSSEMSTEMAAKNHANDLLNEALTQTFRINGKEYKTKAFLGGLSGKIVFKVETNGNKYIIKMNAGKTADPVAKENQALRADSPFMDAIVDFHLKAHDCKNSVHPHYYSYESDSILYPFVEGKTLGETINNPHKIFDILTMNKKHLNDANNLGIYANDCKASNFIVNKEGDVVMPDIGNVTYVNALRPGGPGYSMNINNLCGKNMANYIAGLNL